MTEADAHAITRVPQWTFGDRLRKVRRDAGDTQAEFAEKLGESAKTYSNWEADRHPPASIVAVAKRVELATNVSAAWMLGVMEAPPAGPASPAAASSVPSQDSVAGSSRRDTEFMQRRCAQLGTSPFDPICPDVDDVG